MEKQKPKYDSLKQFLDSKNAELYDFKYQFDMEYLYDYLEGRNKDYSDVLMKIKNLTSSDPIERFLNYKNQSKNDLFDCDGSGEGKQGFLCWLSREIYRTLWDWKDYSSQIEKNDGRIKELKVNRYGNSCFDNGAEMGPETLNSIKTTYNVFEKMKETEYKNSIKEQMVLFANNTHSIGNMSLTYKGYNKYVGKDYWDIKLKKQFLINHEKSFNEYINTFFQWDYVDEDYKVKSLFDKSFCKKININKEKLDDNHSKYLRGEQAEFLPNDKEIKIYLENVNWAIVRRGIFMVTMLKIATKYEKIYEIIREIIYSKEIIKEKKGETVVYGYEAVFIKLNNLEIVSQCEEIKTILCLAKQTIQNLVIY